MPVATAPPAKKRAGRKKGTPKSGGRKKGTRNRNSMSMLAALDKANIPVVEFLIKDILEIDDPTRRVNEWHRILRFCYPRLKSVEYALPQQPDPGPQTPDPATNVSSSSLKDIAKNGN